MDIEDFDPDEGYSPDITLSEALRLGFAVLTDKGREVHRTPAEDVADIIQRSFGGYAKMAGKISKSVAASFPKASVEPRVYYDGYVSADAITRDDLVEMNKEAPENVRYGTSPSWMWRSDQDPLKDLEEFADKMKKSPRAETVSFEAQKREVAKMALEEAKKKTPTFGDGLRAQIAPWDDLKRRRFFRGL